MSHYGFMSKEKYETEKDSYTMGVRFSVDDTQALVKLRHGQDPTGVDIRSHEETLAITSGPDWTPEED